MEHLNLVFDENALFSFDGRFALRTPYELNFKSMIFLNRFFLAKHLIRKIPKNDKKKD